MKTKGNTVTLTPKTIRTECGVCGADLFFSSGNDLTAARVCLLTTCQAIYRQRLMDEQLRSGH